MFDVKINALKVGYWLRRSGMLRAHPFSTVKAHEVLKSAGLPTMILHKLNVRCRRSSSKAVPAPTEARTEAAYLFRCGFLMLCGWEFPDIPAVSSYYKTLIIRIFFFMDDA